MLNPRDEQDHFHTYLTQANLDSFKELFHDDPVHQQLSTVTVDQLLAYSRGKAPSGHNATLNTQLHPLPSRDIFSPCLLAWSGLAFNTFSFVTGLLGLRIPLSERMEIMIAKAFDITYIERNALKVALDTLKDEQVAKGSKVLAVLSIARTVSQGISVSIIVKAIFRNLTLWDGIMFGVLALATWVSALATGGLSLVAYAVASAVGIGLIISSAINVHQVCYTERIRTTIILAGGNGAGSDANQLNRPTAFDIDVNGNIYIADLYNHRIQKWAPGLSEGVTVAGGNGQGNLMNQFNSPEDVILDAQNNIYVADTANHRVQKWTPGATEGITVAGTGQPGQAANQLFSPTCLAFDNNGNLFVGEGHNSRVQKWAMGATQGVMVAGSVGADGYPNIGNGLNEFHWIGKLAVANFDMNGRPGSHIGDLYICDVINQRVVCWKVGATAGVIVPGAGTERNQLTSPEGILLSPDGVIYVCDYLGSKILKLAPGATNGEVVAGGNGSGSALNQINPVGVKLDKNGNLIILDRSNHRVLKIIV